MTMQEIEAEIKNINAKLLGPLHLSDRQQRLLFKDRAKLRAILTALRAGEETHG